MSGAPMTATQAAAATERMALRALRSLLRGGLMIHARAYSITSRN